MRRREHQLGFGTIEILLVVLVVAVLTVTGFVVYQHHKPPSAKNSAATSHSQTTHPQSTATTQTQQTATQYLTIKEWGVKLPLSNSVKDAYYVVPTGISLDEDGRPSGIILGLTSLNSSCGSVSPGGSGYANSFGEIVRVLPTDKDPVSDKLYTQLLPDGTTLGSYYYGYSSSIKSKTCAPQATLQSVDLAFATTTKGIMTATN